jgi:hypothetical protein
LARHAERGMASLADASRAPKTHPNQSPPEVEGAVLRLRKARPTWGSKKILATLDRERPDEKSRAEESQRDPAQGIGFFRTGGARPPTEVMVSFIDEHRCGHGVEPICEALPIAPSTYHERKVVARDLARRSARAKRDGELREHIERIFKDHHGVYGARQVWHQLQREGLDVARCTVERLMRRMGLQGLFEGAASRRPSRARPPSDRSIWFSESSTR